MRSSSSSNAEDETETMFPSTAQASSSANPLPPTGHSTFLPNAEPSPPSSQDPPQANGGPLLPLEDPMDYVATIPTSVPAIPMSITSVDVRAFGGGDAVAEEEKNQPGATWMNTKAQGDFKRAYDALVDKDFLTSIQDLPDPLEEPDATDG
ncbi:MAG: hypothetical protein M1834_001801 [Cirrosporium novae-zelandiae]|nr:MAG: hypothetical protein M1834_001801 [Cirrosporium novae-zelandiae]